MEGEDHQESDDFAGWESRTALFCAVLEALNSLAGAGNGLDGEGLGGDRYETAPEDEAVHDAWAAAAFELP